MTAAQAVAGARAHSKPVPVALSLSVSVRVHPSPGRWCRTPSGMRRIRAGRLPVTTATALRPWGGGRSLGRMARSVSSWASPPLGGGMFPSPLPPARPCVKNTPTPRCPSQRSITYPLNVVSYLTRPIHFMLPIAIAAVCDCAFR